MSNAGWGWGWGNALALGGAPPLVDDKFTGSSGTALADHTPDIGGAWVDVAPGLDLDGSGRVHTDGATGDYPESHILAAADLDLSATIYLVSPEFVGVLFRCNGANHPWSSQANGGKYLEMSPTGFFRVNGWESGAWGVEAQWSSPSVPAGEEFTVRIVCQGSSIEVYMNGTLRIDYLSTLHQSNEYVGLSHNKDQGNSGNSYFDNLLVRSV